MKPRSTLHCHTVAPTALPMLTACMIVLATAGFVIAQKRTGAEQFSQSIREKNLVLDSIRQELERGRSRIAALQQAEGTHVAQLEQLEANIATAQVYLRVISARIDTVGHQIEAQRLALGTAHQSLTARRRQMRKRLRAMYMTPDMGLLQILLTSATAAQVLDRSRYFLELKRYDQSLLAGIDSTRTRIEHHTRQLESSREQLAELLAGKKSEQEQLVAQKAERATMLAKVKQEKGAYVAMVRDLEQAQRELLVLLQTLEEQRRKAAAARSVKPDVATRPPESAAAGVFEKRKGTLPWPVEGTVVKEYGRIVHPVYETVTMSTGIDILARPGDAVSSVAEGTVDYVGWMRGYGQFVIVNHAGGYVSIYTHLDSIGVARGQGVPQGTVLGLVGGRGGEQKSTVHFEIRRSTDALDPRQWLRRVR